MGTSINSEYHGAVGPRTKINVPKEFVLYQISKNLDSIMNDQNSSAIRYSSRDPNYTDLGISSRHRQGHTNESYLDSI